MRFWRFCFQILMMLPTSSVPVQSLRLAKIGYAFGSCLSYLLPGKANALVARTAHTARANLRCFNRCEPYGSGGWSCQLPGSPLRDSNPRCPWSEVIGAERPGPTRKPSSLECRAVWKRIPLIVVCAMVTLVGGSASAGGRSPADRVTLTVLLRDEATAAEREAIEKIVRDLPDATKIRFESREAAYQRFKEMFKDQPDLVTTTNPEHLPESFMASLPARRRAEAAAVAMRSVPGVDYTTLKGEWIAEKPSLLGVIVYLKAGASDADRIAIEQKLRGMSSTKTVRYESRGRAYQRLHASLGESDPLVWLIDKNNVAASFRAEVSTRKKSDINWVWDQPGVETWIGVPVAALS